MRNFFDRIPTPAEEKFATTEINKDPEVKEIKQFMSELLQLLDKIIDQENQGNDSSLQIKARELRDAVDGFFDDPSQLVALAQEGSNLKKLLQVMIVKSENVV